MKILITDHNFPDVSIEENILSKYGIEVIAKQCKTEEDVIISAVDVDGIINQYAPITKNVIDNLSKCKVIARYGVGVDTIDFEAATEKNISVAYVPDYGIEEVSNHALSLILDINRKVTYANNLVNKGTWSINSLQPIKRFNTLTIGLIGFGNIPRSLAKKLSILGPKIIVSDPFTSTDVEAEYNVTNVSIEELCQQSDIISVHCPLLKETHKMINKEKFNLMKDGVSIVNTARGPIIDEAALIEAIENGKVGAAALDVLETEPPTSDNKLLEFDNVIITPHVGGYSVEAYEELRAKATLAMVDVLLNNQKPKYLFNKKVENDLSEFSNNKHYLQLSF